MEKKTLTVDQALVLAQSHATKGEEGKARQLYLMILAKFPMNKKAKEGLEAIEKNSAQKTQGDLKPLIDRLIALYSGGRLKDALSEAKRLSNAHTDAPFLHNIIAACHVGLGQPEAAVMSYKQALAIKPDYVEVHNNLGTTLADQGHLDAAVASFERALQIKPDYVEAHHNLGHIFSVLEQFDTAISSYKRVLEIRPEQLEAHNNLGVIFRHTGQMDEAVASFKRALEIKPDYVEAHNNLGNVFRELGQADAAIASFKQALEIKPDCAEAHSNLGCIFGDLAQPDAEIASYQRALEVNPAFAEAHYYLSLHKAFKPGDKHIALMEHLLSDSNSSDAERTHLCFALAEAYEDLGDYNVFFNYLTQANGLRKKTTRYDIDSSKRFFSVIKDVFNTQKDSFSAAPTDDHSALRPVFIVGMPRSGTTLVEQILASHTKVFGAGELKTMGRIMDSNLSPPAERVVGQRNKSVSNIDIDTIRGAYRDALAELRVPEKIITDKMPSNFRWIGFILSAFPAAKIINLNRDAMATCWSIYRRLFASKGLAYAYDMVDLAQYYKLYIDLMSFWREQFPHKIYDICYEDLTKNQVKETRKLLEYCNLDWEESCLNFHKTQRPVRTASTAQVRQKMYQGSSEAWKKYETHLEPLIKSLGYQVSKM